MWYHTRKCDNINDIVCKTLVYVVTKNFFDYYPEQIFSPLTGYNRRLYLDVLTSIYHRFFDETADFDEVSFPAFTIRSHIEEVIRSKKFWIDETSGKQEVINDITDLTQRVYYIFQRLTESGWLKTERQGHKDYVFMSPRIIELMQFLDSAGREISKHVGGSVLSVFNGLKTLTDEKATGPDIVSSLELAVDGSKSMARRMSRLASHLRDISEKISEFPDAIQKAEAFFEGFVNESTFVDYNDIKKRNHPMRFKAEILQLIHEIEFNSVIHARVIKALENDTAIIEPPEVKLDGSLSVIRQIFFNTDNLLDRIDKTHVKLVHRFSEALRYRRRVGSDLKERIEDTFALIRESPQLDKLALYNPMPEISAISSESLYKIKRQKRTLAPDSGTQIRKVSAEEILKGKLHRAYLRKMSINDVKLNDWLDSLLTSSREVSSSDISVETPEEFAMFIQARRLCSNNDHFTTKFRNTLALFNFTLTSDDEREHDVVYCREFSIQRRVDIGK